MIIYHDAERGHKLTRTRTGKRRNGYKTEIFGWYGGGFSAKSDTEAIRIFENMINAETEARKEC